MTRYATLKKDMKFVENSGVFTANPLEITIPAYTIVEVQSLMWMYYLFCGDFYMRITKEQAPNLLDFLE